MASTMIPDHYANSDGGLEHTTGAERQASQDQAKRRYFTASDEPRVVDLRQLITALGSAIDLLVPPGRNKALALTALEDVQMRANRGIFAPEELR